MLYVIMEGGICQGVCSDQPDQHGIKYTVIDYDCDQCDPHDDNVHQVEQADGSTQPAFIGRDFVGRMTCTIRDTFEPLSELEGR